MDWVLDIARGIVREQRITIDTVLSAESITVLAAREIRWHSWAYPHGQSTAGA